MAYCKELINNNMQSYITKKFVEEPRSMLQGHEITGEHRAKMLDWMIQVYGVLRTSSR